MSFLTTFLSWTEQYPSPESYFRWAALSAISTVMRDNMCNIWGNNDRLYPNMFIMLVGPPALGKQLPITKSSGLVKAVNNTKILQGSASIQAVIKSLGEYETGGLKGASGLILAPEYASFHAGDQQNTNDLLTDLWDFHPAWERNLISWQATLKNVCISMMAGSNETLLKGILDQRALFGGLLSRMILVIETRPRHKSGLIRKTSANGVYIAPVDPIEVKLKAHLTHISKMRGEITFEEDAILEYEHWYMNQWDEDNPRTRTGVEGRMKTHIKKVAMALALCEWNLDPVVRKQHIEHAIELCVGLYKNYIVLSAEAGSNPTAHPMAQLIRYLGTSPNQELKRKTILSRHLGDFNPDILSEAAQQLEEGNLIYIIDTNGEISYKLTPQCMEMYSIVKKKTKEA